MSEGGPYGSEPQPRIVDRCPTCGGTIFIGAGGYLTCASLPCSEPGIGRAIEKLRDDLAAQKASVSLLEQKLDSSIDRIADLHAEAEFRRRLHEAAIEAALDMHLEGDRSANTEEAP